MDATEINGTEGNTTPRWIQAKSERIAISGSARKSWLIRVLLLGFMAIAGTIVGLVIHFQRIPSTFCVTFCPPSHNGVVNPLQLSNAIDWNWLNDHGLSDAGIKVLERKDAPEITGFSYQVANVPDGSTLIAYVSGELSSLSDGSVAIKISDQEQGINENIQLSRILSVVARSSAVNKLLVLDVSGAGGGLDGGGFNSRLFEILSAQVNASEGNQFSILLPCDQGESSNIIWGRDRTVLGYFFERGIVGEADGADGFDKDGRISAAELAVYLQNSVRSYSLVACVTPQTPQFITSGEDFPLVSSFASLRNRMKALDLIGQDGSAYPTWLGEYWNQVRWLSSSESPEKASVAELLKLQSALFSAERAWFAGEPERQVVSGFNSNLIKLCLSENVVEPVRIPSDTQLETGKTEVASAGAANSNGSSQDIAIGSKKNDTFGNGPTNTKPASKKLTYVSIGDLSQRKESISTYLSLYNNLQNKLSILVDGLTSDLKLSDSKASEKAVEKRVDQFASTIAFEDRDRLVESVFQFVSSKGDFDLSVLAPLVKLISRFNENQDPLLFDILQELLKRNDESAIPYDELKRIQLALQVILSDERSLNSFSNVPLLRPFQNRLSNSRYVCETLIWKPSFVAVSTIDEQLNEAINLSSQLNELTIRIQEVEETARLAALHLPYLLNVAKTNPTLFDGWTRATANAIDLKGIYEHSPVESEVEFESGRREALAEESRIDSLRRIQSLVQKAAVVRQDIQTLLSVVSNDRIEELIIQSQSDDAGPECLEELLLALNTPFPKGEQREVLYRSALDLSNRVHNLAIIGLRQSGGSSRSSLPVKPSGYTPADSFAKLYSDGSGIQQLRNLSSMQSAVPMTGTNELSRDGLWRRLAETTPYGEDYSNRISDWASKSGGRDRVISSDTSIDLASRIVSTGIDPTIFSDGIKASDLSLSILPQSSPGLQITNARLETVQGKIYMVCTIVADAEVQRMGISGKVGFFAVIEGHGNTLLLPIELPEFERKPSMSLSLVPVNQPFRDMDTMGALQLKVEPNSLMQPYQLWLNSSFAAPREVRVEFGGLSQTLLINSGVPTPISFPGKPPKSVSELAEWDPATTIRVYDQSSNELLAERPILLSVRLPEDYVEVVNAYFYDYAPARNRLEITLRKYPAVGTLDSEATLTLEKGKLPGLLRVEGGKLAGTIPSDGSEITLYAENLIFDESQGETGSFSLEVDGVDRAFVFSICRSGFGLAIEPELIRKPIIEINSTPTGLAGQGFPVRVSVCNVPLESDISLLLAKNIGEAAPDLKKNVTTSREIKLGYKAATGDAIYLHAELDDWQFQLDTSSLVGKRVWEAVVESQGKPVVKAQRLVSLEDQPPSFVRFLNIRNRVAALTKISLSIAAESRLTGIRSVEVFVGDLVDGKPPTGAKLVAAIKSSDSDNSWKVDVPLGKTLGPLTIHALATNGAGLTTTESTEVNVVTADQLNIGAISGDVWEGSVPQPNLKVTLADITGKKIQSLTTDFNGAFRFSDIPVGGYKLNVEKASSQRRGEAVVKVRKDEVAKVQLILAL